MNLLASSQVPVATVPLPVGLTRARVYRVDSCWAMPGSAPSQAILRICVKGRETKDTSSSGMVCLKYEIE